MPEEFDALEDLAAELRQRVEREIRWEAEDVEADVEKGRVRKRSLGDVAAELMHHGDTVAVGSAQTELTGRFIYASGDLAVLQTGHAIASVNLAGPIYIKVTRRSPQGGVSSTTGGSGSFKARLAEFEQTGEPLRVIATGLAESIEARITIAASDHVVVTNRDGIEWILPSTTIAMVLQPITRR